MNGILRGRERGKKFKVVKNERILCSNTMDAVKKKRKIKKTLKD